MVIVGVLALSGCGSDSDEETATTIAAPAESGTSTSGQATSETLLAASVEVDGVVYFISCTGVSPSSLSDPLGTTEYLDGDVAIRLLAGVNVANAIAVEVSGGACAPGERQLSDWSIAIAQGVDDELASQIACDSGLKSQGC